MDKDLDNNVCFDSEEVLRMLQEWRVLVEERLSSLAAEVTAESALLREATTYVLQGAGKKLRGLLILSIAKDILGSHGDSSSALGCAVAAEVVHAASLVHDDLPALDNDDYRRGRPSCHRAFNEATAILVGDLLVGAAFSCVASSGDLPERRALVCELLARTWTELCVGQQLDLQGMSAPEQQRRMVELKTGSLFGFAAACGAACVGSEREVVDRMFNWGVRLGIAFQMLDDVDDGECSRDALVSVERERESLLGELREYLGGAPHHSVTIVRRILNTQREEGVKR
jgi:geranylgeranyl diphosphate synthase type II